MTPMHARMMADHGTWMSGRMLALCGKLTNAERKRDLGAFFKSIRGTFDHLVYGDVASMGRLTGSAMPTRRIGAIVRESWDELAAARRALNRRIEGWAADVTEQWLAETMSYVSGNDGKTRLLARWVLVTRMFNHATHHRGQVTTLMEQLGIEPVSRICPGRPRFTTAACWPRRRCDR